MFTLLFWIAVSTFVSEDLACISAGVLISQGKIGYVDGLAACLTGIFLGDLLLFAAGRLLGPKLLSKSWVARYLLPSRVAEAAAWLDNRGLAVVLLSRFTPGLRLPTYFAAGVLRIPVLRFSLALLLAAVLWTPLLVSASAHLSLAWIPALLLATYLLQSLLRQMRSHESRRRFVGSLRRKMQWEFWPIWAAYLPLVPYFIYLAIRHRSLTVFTAANPGIVSGGLLGESKSAILRQLDRLPGTVPTFTVLPPVGRLQAALDFLQEHQMDFPVVLKPDVGERGEGVAIIRSHKELELYLAGNPGAVILQRYAAGVEFGVFYYRFPGESNGQIFSITEKRFPTVVGDGQRSVGELILEDERAVCMANTYARLCRTPMDVVPGLGEVVPLVEVGSHCRGAIFLNATRLKTTAMEDAIDAVAQMHNGFFFGRFDIRAASVEALQEGHSFQVIELNGVGGEATHIYDPSVSIQDAYRSLATQWRLAFEIGSMNRERGAVHMSIGGLRRQFALRFPG